MYNILNLKSIAFAAINKRENASKKFRLASISNTLKQLIESYLKINIAIR